MPNTIFVTLPVTDVARAAAFYAALGFERDPTFSSATGASMRWSDTIVVGLLDRGVFGRLTDKRIVDPHTETGALLALSLDSRADVDAMTRIAVEQGGRELHGAEDEGFMYSRAFADPDGNGWGPMFIDMAAAPRAMAERSGGPA